MRSLTASVTSESIVKMLEAQRDKALMDAHAWQMSEYGARRGAQAKELERAIEDVKSGEWLKYTGES